MYARLIDARPLYLIFAGVNGAGKSTFYRSDMWRMRGMQGAIPRVNPDELLVAANGDPNSTSNQLKAAREAIRKIDGYIAKQHSFNQETTLCGKLSLKHIRNAKSKGFRIVMYYIGVASPQLAEARIQHRAELGGHFINPATVERRYWASISTFSRALDLCDIAIAIDNSEEFVSIAQWQQGILSWVGNLKHHGAWLMEAINIDNIWRPC